MCFYVFPPTYTPNHTKSLWIEIHSPSPLLPWPQLRGSDLGGCASLPPHKLSCPSPWPTMAAPMEPLLGPLPWQPTART